MKTYPQDVACLDVMWTGLNWLRTLTIGRLFIEYWNFGYHRRPDKRFDRILE